MDVDHQEKKPEKISEEEKEEVVEKEVDLNEEQSVVTPSDPPQLSVEDIAGENGVTELESWLGWTSE